MIDGYYNRFAPEKNYEQHLFRAGYVLQSAELNEIQAAARDRVRGIADALFKDGDIIRDAQILVNGDTGETLCGSGAIYLKGAVRGVAPKTVTIPVVGLVTVGIRLVSTVITELEDPALRDPASLVRNYMEPGAAREQLVAVWGFQGDGETIGEFYPIYTVENGVVRSKEPPPNLDSVTHAIATYDRDNSGGNYVVNGLSVESVAGPDANTDGFVVSAGRARVQGYAVTQVYDTRLNRPRTPDLRLISAEPKLATGVASQRINLDRTPVNVVLEVNVTRDKAVSITRGMVAGGMDNLPDSSVLQLVSVTQGATTYVVGTDVRLTGGKVDWSLAGAEPSGGSTYSVTYRYVATETPAPGDWDEDGLSVENAVSGSLILITYEARLPRVDRLCIDRDGAFVWATGIADDYAPGVPPAPIGALPLARVIHTWRAGVLPRVINDAVRTVSMGELQQINARIDGLADILARNQLASSANMREAILKKGILVDPFLDNSVRDLGIAQDAAVANGALTLPIIATASVLEGSNQQPNVLTRTSFSATLKQEARTGGMKINPYMSFPPVPAVVTLSPAKDYWTETKVRETSDTTYQNITTSSSQTANLGTNYYWGYGSYQSYAGSSSSSSSSTSASSSTSVSSYKIGDLENLRQIEVTVSASGFGPGETLEELRFDGIVLTPTAV